ncbi:VCBS domain-containing protein, partial [Sphingobium tyrosinilyticum]
THMFVGANLQSTNAAGTVFTVADLSSAQHILGGSGNDTLIAQGFTFSTAQRNAIFAQSSVEIIQDSSGSYADDGTLVLSGNAAEGGSLTATLTMNNAVSTSYQWQQLVAGSWIDIPGADDSSFNVPDDQSFVGQTIRVRATSTDGLGVSRDFISFTKTISNVDDPAVGTLDVTGVAIQSGTLSASLTNVVDADGPTTIGYQWEVLIGNTWAHIANASTAVLNIPSDQSYVGKQVRVVATTTDALGGTTTFASNGQTVTNVDDAASGTLNVTGTFEESGTLTAALTNVIDPDGLTSTDYRWQMFTAGTWTDISGAASASLTIPSDQSYVGQQIRVVATTTDALGGTTAFISSGQIVANVDDAATGTLDVSGSARKGGMLTAALTNVIDPDGATGTAYRWQMLIGGAWTDIGAAISATLSIPDDQSFVGRQVRVVATTTDTLGGTTTFISSGQTIADVNSAPVVTNLIIEQHLNEDSSWSFSVPANTFTDPDGNPLTYSALAVDSNGIALPMQPAWLAFNAATQAFSGTPPLNFNGSYYIKVSASDGSLSASTIFKLVVDPVQDAAIIGNPTAAAITEDVSVSGGNLIASGILSISDPDAGEAAFKTAVTSAPGNLGSLVLNANGTYTYSVPNAAIQYLGDGMIKTETFTVTAVDNTSKQISFTINGANEIINGTSAKNTINGTSAHETINGLGGNDVLNAGDGDDKLFGGDGNDTLNGEKGSDRLDGGIGNDDLIGGPGTDTLLGGAGNDKFIFQLLADLGIGTARDIIQDFAPGADVIDLRLLDANAGVKGDQAFKFVAAQTTAVLANSITWHQDSGNGITLVQGDVNGDGTADFQIQLLGMKALTASDFGL